MLAGAPGYPDKPLTLNVFDQNFGLCTIKGNSQLLA